MSNERCAIWGTDLVDYGLTGEVEAFNSNRAGGVYRMSRSARAILPHRPVAYRPLLTTWIVDQHRAGVEYPTITSDNLDQIGTRRPLRYTDRLQRFFLFLSFCQHTIGSDFDTEDAAWRDYVAAWTECDHTGQVDDLMTLLRESHLVDPTLQRLTPAGFRALESVESGGAHTRQAFVAQWFGAEMNAVFEEGFAPAIRRAGYEPFRIDQKEHANRIDDEIIAEIRRSRFLVADFTCSIFEMAGQKRSEARGGVYYEAGFAQGLGTPVIWTVRKDCIDQVHFDTRQFAHIVWETSQDLAEKLYNRIAAVIGDALIPRRAATASPHFG